MDFNALLRQQAEGDRDLRRVEPQIAATAKYLRSHSSFLDLISIEIVQRLIQIYGQLLDQEITSDTILINIKNLAQEQLDKQKAWEIIAQKNLDKLNFWPHSRYATRSRKFYSRFSRLGSF